MFTGKTNFLVRLLFDIINKQTLIYSSTTSSIRSYSSRRFEQEIRDKELRQEMKKHLCRLQEQQQMQKLRPQIIIGDSIPYTVSKQIQMPSTSPHILTPNSMDELLPSVEENDEFSPQFDRKNQPWWQTCTWLTEPLNWISKKKKLKFATIFIVRSKKKSKTNVKCLLISK